MATPSNDKLAVLFDADNAQAAVAPELLAEVARYGTATVKRAYGDWTTPNLAPWKETLHALAIQPIQQFRFTTALLQAISAAGREDGWAALSAVGSLVMKASPSFDPRNYGFQKLGELVRAQPYLEVKSVPVGDGSPNVHLFVRRRDI